MPESTDYKVIAEQDLLYLLSAGEEDGYALGRVYDRRRGLVGPVQYVGSIVNHMPGWEDPDLSEWSEKQLLLEVARLLAVAPEDPATV